MIKTEITLPLKYNSSTLFESVRAALPLERVEQSSIRLLRRTLVSNGDGHPYYKATVAISLSPERERALLKIKHRFTECPEYSLKLPSFRASFRPIVVGFGPCGMFAALALAEAGARPIVLERGLCVEEREKKVNTFHRLGVLDPECNVQFGEGGAGTYSDGKLKSGAMDKYKLKVLTTLVEAGGAEEILYSSSAHLGTDRLSSIVKKIREKIISLGGEIIFGARVTDLSLKDGVLTSVTYERDGERVKVPTRAAIFATGHSAYDTVKMLKDLGLGMEARGFGIGLRIEHPREYINEIVYRGDREYIEEAASYHLVTHLENGRSVYSFCMCPGGTVVAAASETGGIVTNGMSENARMASNSNAALLVSVTPRDFDNADPLSGFTLQRKIEGMAFSLSGEYRAPCFRLADFLDKSEKTTLASVLPSYPCGTVSASPDEYLPSYITDSLRLAMPSLDAWLHGYSYPDAVLTGPETRTTSPVRIVRDENGVAVGFFGIYPAGEGAGYSGGIVSSAVDGIRTAERLIACFCEQ
ncbi:MAG: hypothetical protein IKL79_02965 [Clostridia bacterium]|nr:hypothetical protein [Clostridia bacterium]